MRSGLPASLTGGAYRIDYFHNSADWFWSAGVQRFADDFRADGGFVNQNNLKRSQVEIGRNWRGQPGALVQNFNIGIDADYAATVSSGALLRRNRTLIRSRGRQLETQLLFSCQLNPRSVFAGYPTSGMPNDALGGIEKTSDTVFMKVFHAFQM